MDTENSSKPAIGVDAERENNGVSRDGGNTGRLRGILMFAALAGVAIALFQLRGAGKPSLGESSAERESPASSTISAGTVTKQKVKELQASGQTRNEEVESFFK
jgi:hypothetical protein